MRLLVNTLSIGSMSGEHVVYGFLRPLIAKLADNDSLVIVHCDGQPPPGEISDSEQVITHAISDRFRHWALRAGWEALRLPGLIRKFNANRVLNVSGAITPFLKTPQVSLAMNPWCYITEARSGLVQEFKALMQRRGHRYAFRNAEQMVYISVHLRDLYRNANQDSLDREAPSTIAYVGLDDQLFASAEETKSLERKPYSILCVSALAPWKGAETLVEAVNLLRLRDIPAVLDLVGPWPDQAYREKIEALIALRGLSDAIRIHGKVPVEELYRHNATHQVYCLMSSSESFGIPAAEAMAFGTPIVSADCCAIAEICDRAGLFGPVNDPVWTAQALESLLTDEIAWGQLSDSARDKASRLTWSQCVEPLFEVLGLGRAA
ncbi:glycosyltransferase family 4 protein [Pseudomonadota bacterium]